MVCRRTQAALEIWREMAESSSTPSSVLPLPKRQKIGSVAGAAPLPVARNPTSESLRAIHPVAAAVGAKRSLEEAA